jgi:uncharacterized protein DUF3560
MSVITIVHTERDGTLIEGSSKGDGVYEVLLDLRCRGQGNWRYFRSLGQLGLGQSRDKPAQRWKIDTAAEALRAAGHQVEVSIDNDTRRTFAEAEADRYQRAEDRTLYHDEVAGRAAGRSEAAYRAEHRIIDGYPAGQPILVGHHSERRHRRDLERADAHRRRAWDEQDKAGYHADRADAAERYQAGRESVPVTLRRIAKLEAEARQVQRRLDGTDKFMSYGHPATGEWREQLLTRARDINEELGYWRKHIAARQADGAKVWEPADFAKGDFVQIGLGAWHEVIRVNKKTLTLPAIIAGPGRTVLRADESGYPWTDTVPYDKVTARKNAAEIAELLTGTPAQETTASAEAGGAAAQPEHAGGHSQPGTEAENPGAGPDDEH